jgi:hypothetical protein
MSRALLLGPLRISAGRRRVIEWRQSSADHDTRNHAQSQGAACMPWNE